MSKERLKRLTQWASATADHQEKDFAGRELLECGWCGGETRAPLRPCSDCLRLVASVLRSADSPTASAECGPARGVLLKVPHGSGERYRRFLTWDKETLAKLADELTDEVIRLRSCVEESGDVGDEKSSVLPVCGDNGIWCHETCYRHSRCMYANISTSERK
jgi:membrane-bound inhibitor of C-type lysozyme